MSRSKKIFLLLAGLFFALMIYIGYDISSKTTFPGSKPQLKERLLKSDTKTDSAQSVNKEIENADSLEDSN